MNALARLVLVGCVCAMTMSGSRAAGPVAVQVTELAQEVRIELSLGDTLDNLANDFLTDWSALSPASGGLTSVTLGFAFSDAWSENPIQGPTISLMGLLDSLKITATGQPGSVSYLVESNPSAASTKDIVEGLAFASIVVQRPSQSTGMLDLMLVKFGGQDAWEKFDEATGETRVPLASVTISPVPEPATYMLMVAGLVLLVFSARRRPY